jgi:hypothetical protein
MKAIIVWVEKNENPPGGLNNSTIPGSFINGLGRATRGFTRNSLTVYNITIAMIIKTASLLYFFTTRRGISMAAKIIIPAAFKPTVAMTASMVGDPNTDCIQSRTAISFILPVD